MATLWLLIVHGPPLTLLLLVAPKGATWFTLGNPALGSLFNAISLATCAKCWNKMEFDIPYVEKTRQIKI